ncbi:glycoside hydrolase family 3 protein [Paenibacillus sp. YN15]|uniref:glycoside hydrolase family 3 protein n=1 Tax=Paenibacillus sp. YN15 TaxID=1742774 RepID=UPI000DCCAE03|nr:glycoside hydrolase family 3 N-terminal domain-containing protein [Paenibacillus sp. YN15]RAV01970.1 hypothetical protein DQG13_10605 [Paenibacillus sp. YN15]
MDHIFSQEPSLWVRSTLDSMSLKEKVGQLIISRESRDTIEDSIAKGHVGGFYAANHVSGERITKLKSLSKTPLLVAQDLEVGHCSGALSWPSAMALGAIDDEETAYNWAYYQALDARRQGVNAVFGPVLDVALNPESQATSTRPLSGDPQQAARLAAAVVKGYQDAGLLPFAKHFPGFGRGNQDVHLELSKYKADKQTLLKEDLLPYRQAIQEASLAGIMTGHIRIDEIDSELPMPLSSKQMELLKEIGFNGLTITDSLSMKGIQYLYQDEILYPGAILSGHDMILANNRLPDELGLEYVVRTVEDGRIPLAEIERRVIRILQMKEYLEQVPLRELDVAKAASLFSSMSQRSMTALRSDGEAFQAINPSWKSLFVIVSQEFTQVEGELSAAHTPVEMLADKLKERFPNSDIAFLPIFPSASQNEELLHKSLAYEQVHIVANAVKRAYSGIAHYQDPLLSMVRAMQTKIGTFVVFGNPAAAKDLPALPQLLFCYGGYLWIEACVEVLSGRLRPEGKLPIRY